MSGNDKARETITFRGSLVPTVHAAGCQGYRVLAPAEDWSPAPLCMVGFTTPQSVREAKPQTLLQDYAEFRNVTVVAGVAGVFDLANAQYINSCVHCYKDVLDASWYQRYGLILARDHCRALIQAESLHVSRAISLFSWVNENYAHWIFEQLPRFYWISQLELPEDTVVLVEKSLPASILESLALFWPAERIVQVARGQRVDVDELYHLAPTADIWEPSVGYVYTGLDFHIYPPAFEWMASKVLEHYQTPSRLFEHAAYLFRPPSFNGRAIVQQDRLIQTLADQHVASLDPGRLGLGEQVTYFASTTLVISGSGAAVTNLLWMPRGSTVVVLIQDIPEAWYWFFHSIAAARGIQLIYFKAEGVEGSHWVRFHLDLRVSPEALVNWLHSENLLPKAGIQPFRISSSSPQDNRLAMEAAHPIADSLPKVSVCICSYNHRDYIAAALDSVIAQSYPHLELVVVDDASSDGTAEILREYAERHPQLIRPHLLGENVGPGEAFNMAMRLAEGEFIALLGSDDVMLPQRLQRQVQFLLSHPGHVAVFSNIAVIDEHGHRHSMAEAVEALFNQPIGNLRRQLLAGNFLNAPSVLMRADVVHRLHGHWSALRYVHDYELWCRLLLEGEIAKIPEVLTQYRQHARNLSTFGPQGARWTAKVEIVTVMGRYARLCPLEQLLNRKLPDAKAHGWAELELAALLELIDRQYFERPLLTTAQAYELVMSASRWLPQECAPLKAHLERVMAEGFDEQTELLHQQLPSPFQWFAEPLAQLLLTQKRQSGSEPLNKWLAARVPTPVQARLIGEYFQHHVRGGSVSVLLNCPAGSQEQARRTLKSLDNGLYRKIQVVLLGEGAPDFTPRHIAVLKGGAQADFGQAFQCGLLRANGDWLLMVDAGDQFTSTGLLLAILQLSQADSVIGACCDELLRSENGEIGPAFRPTPNLDMMLSFPAGVARHWLWRSEHVRRMGGLAGSSFVTAELDLLLRTIEQHGLAGLAHIDEPLLTTGAPRLEDMPEERAVIEAHLQRRGFPHAKVESALPRRYAIDFGHAEDVGVSIILPATGGLVRLQQCVEEMLEKTDYGPYELILVATAEQDDEVDSWLAGVEAMGDAKVRVIRDLSGSRRAGCNAAARVARGEYLLLFSSDLVVVRGDWLRQMLNLGQRPEVGLVGAKLVNPRGAIEHAGLILGLNALADSPFRGASLQSPGYMQRLQVDQNYSALSSDCLLIRQALFEELNGFDPEFDDPLCADVDLCLRAGRQGYLVVWASRALLATQAQPAPALPKDAPAEHALPADADLLYDRWLGVLANDPAYNRNLSLHGQGFALDDPLMNWRPLSWRPLSVVLAHPADPWGCGNYRVIQPFHSMRGEGLIDGMLSDGLLSTLDLTRYDPDVVVFQRQVTAERLRAMQRTRRFSRAFKVYELDDYLLDVPKKSAHKMPEDIERILRQGLDCVDRFVVSTPALAEVFAGFHSDIRVVKNRLPVSWWKDLSSERGFGRKPRVGWAGGIGHAGDQELIIEVVKALADEVEWIFMGLCIPQLMPYAHEIHPGVAITQYSQALAALNLDLAVAPLEDNLFNECKSNLRLLEYGACGFPVVCSDVRCYREDDLPVTRVANRTDEWVEAIRAHVRDLDATARQGDQLRSIVRKQWMLEGQNLQEWRATWLPD